MWCCDRPSARSWRRGDGVRSCSARLIRSWCWGVVAGVLELLLAVCKVDVVVVRALEVRVRGLNRHHLAILFNKARWRLGLCGGGSATFFWPSRRWAERMGAGSASSLAWEAGLLGCNRCDLRWFPLRSSSSATSRLAAESLG